MPMLPAKKQIDVKQKIYHLFKTSTTYYILFDDLMDLPIQFGSLNTVLPAVRSVQKSVQDSLINWYERDPKLGWKRNDSRNIWLDKTNPKNQS
jgi:hypothetical protein